MIHENFTKMFHKNISHKCFTNIIHKNETHRNDIYKNIHKNDSQK